MIPLVDLHVHLAAGLDDGPATLDEAEAMCRTLHAEGARYALGLAHQNDEYPDVTPELIRSRIQELTARLALGNIELELRPGAEVMIHPGVEEAWADESLLGVADRRSYLLIELPHSLFVDLEGLIARLSAAGTRPILAHPERDVEVLHRPGVLERWVEAGALVQVSSASVTDPMNRRDAMALRDWFRRDLVHFLGSDGHGVTRRPPRLKQACELIATWAGRAVADRTCSTLGLGVLRGLPVRFPTPKPPARSWFGAVWDRLTLAT